MNGKGPRVRTIVYGGKGRLGSLILRSLEERGQRNESFDQQDNLQDLLQSEGQALILDVTGDAGTAELLGTLLKSPQPKLVITALIIGSTGHSEKTRGQMDQVKDLLPVCLVSNFSLGLTLFEQMMLAKTEGGQTVLELAKSFGFDMALWESHHTQKLDSPSGTALSLAKAFGLPSEKISATRVGRVVGEHTLFLGRDAEEIRIQHIAHERRLFAEGAATLCQALCCRLEKEKIPAGLYRKEDFLLKRLSP